MVKLKRSQRLRALLATAISTYCLIDTRICVAESADTVRPVAAEVREIIFDDAESNVVGWFSHQDSIPAVTSPVHSGTRAMAFYFSDKRAESGDVQYSSSYGLTYTWNSSYNTAPFDRLEFYIHGGKKGGQHFEIKTQTLDNANHSWDHERGVVQIPD